MVAGDKISVSGLILYEGHLVVEYRPGAGEIGGKRIGQSLRVYIIAQVNDGDRGAGKIEQLFYEVEFGMFAVLHFPGIAHEHDPSLNAVGLWPGLLAPQKTAGNKDRKFEQMHTVSFSWKTNNYPGQATG
jgi:hypothetical protein